MKQLKKKVVAFLKNKYNILFLIVLLIFSVTVLRYNTYDVMIADEAHFAWKAQKISENPLNLFKELTWRRHPPLIPLFVSILDIILPFRTAVILIPKLFSLVGIIALYFIGKKLRNEFVGLFAATLLAFNGLYANWANHLYLDIPLTLFFMLAVFFIIEYKKVFFTPKYKTYDYLVFIFFILTLLTKRTGIIIIPFVVLYFLYAFFRNRGLSVKKNKKYVFIYILILLGIILFALLEKNASISIDKIFSTIYTLTWSTFAWIFPYLRVRYIFVILTLLIFVLFLINFKKFKKQKLFELFFILLMWFLSVFLTRLIFDTVTHARYLLPAFPAVFLFLGILIDLSFRKEYYKFGILVLFIIVMLFGFNWNSYIQKEHTCRSAGYYGYKEIGELISNFNGIIFSSNSHQMRFYSGIDYIIDGGLLYGENEWTGIPKQRSVFENETNTNLNTYLITTFIYESPPDWLWSYEEEGAKYLDVLGFEPLHLINITVPLSCLDMINQTQFDNITKFLNFFNYSGPEIQDDYVIMPTIIVFNKTKEKTYIGNNTRI